MERILSWTEGLLWRFLRHLPEPLKNPNIWTSLRLFFLAPLTISFTILHQYPLAFFFFCLGALTDLIDGVLARQTSRFTDFGRVMDPVADKILIIAPALLAWWFLSRPLLIAYFAAEFTIVLMSGWGLIWRPSSVSSRIIGKVTVAFLALSLVPWLYLLPKTATFLIVLNILLALGVFLRWMSVLQYWLILHKPLPR